MLPVFYSTAGRVLAFLLWFQSLRTVDAGVAGTFTVLIPISGALLAVLALGETFTTAHVAAFGFALGAIALATWPVEPRGSG
ncbi:EamA family transporter [Thalassobaculum sp.]|uniref:EamA family transporter n=1 Tax=Thalassobaculum sp. TaxID=2022740 RepID=UPI0032EBB55B